MKKIYICSPCRGNDGNYEKHIGDAKRHAREIADHALPICPHIYFTQFMSDNSPGDREKALEYGLELLKMCDEVHVWEWEFPSEGMKRELDLARELKIPIRYRDECIGCGFRDSDREACLCPPHEKFYQCPLECEDPENKKEFREYCEFLSKREDGKELV